MCVSINVSGKIFYFKNPFKFNGFLDEHLKPLYIRSQCICKTFKNCKNTAERSYSLSSCFKFEMRLETTILVTVFLDLYNILVQIRFTTSKPKLDI